MKKLLALSLAFSAIVFSASAQEQADIKKDKAGKYQRHHGKENMMKDLNLTDAQKTQMKADREAYKIKLKGLKDNKSLSATDVKNQKAALHQEQKAKMESLLTADQKTKMAASRATMQARQKEMSAKRSAEFKTKLGLSDDQAAKLKSQQEATRAQMKAIRDDQSMDTDAKKAKMKALKQSSFEQRKSIFTADQLKKMEEMKKDHKNKAGKKERKTISK